MDQNAPKYIKNVSISKCINIAVLNLGHHLKYTLELADFFMITALFCQIISKLEQAAISWRASGDRQISLNASAERAFANFRDKKHRILQLKIFATKT